MMTDAQKRAEYKYQATLKQINLKIKPALYSDIEQHAELSGLSVRAFILTAINEKIERIDETNANQE